jgi:uncharacterized protein (UPF0264 family)
MKMMSAALVVGTVAAIAPAAMAEVVARGHGRCVLVMNDAEIFDGHCTVKQMQNGSQESFVVDLDTGMTYSFSGTGVTGLPRIQNFCLNPLT